MTDWKETLKIQKESLRLGLAETGFSFFGFIGGYPRWKRIVLLTIVIAFIPATIGVRYGVQYYTEWQLNGQLLAAHQSYVQPVAPTVGAVNIIPTSQGVYAAYAEITNENLDVAATGIPYQFDFFNASDQKISTVAGMVFLLSNQKKYLMAPRVETTEAVKYAMVTLGDVKWQKRLVLPQVTLKASSPIISNSTNPLALTLEGVVVNSSAYRLAAVRLQFIVYDKSNKIIAVSQRDEYDIPAFGRRAYKQSWPNLYQDNVGRVVVQPDTDTINGANLIPEDATGTPGSLGAPTGQSN